jgi:hypothetical protein
VVEQSSNDPKVKGLNLGATGTQIQKIAENETSILKATGFDLIHYF